VHRDFQSQNILIRGEKAYLIDFQGMRLGACHYDLGSLLYDPYVTFESAQRLELLEIYYRLNPDPTTRWATFQQAFQEASIQRLMQALGAYGFLSLQKGKRQFLDHVPAGLANLEEAAALAGTTPHLKQLLDQCKKAWKADEAA
jgi:aminoglycoside/choline kinase family phosphotransferase